MFLKNIVIGVFRTAAVVAVLTVAGPANVAFGDWAGCADHCYGTGEGESSPEVGCITYVGGPNDEYCISDGATYCYSEWNEACFLGGR